MHTFELTAPSHWASYLINFDTSMEQYEIATCNEWLRTMGVINADCLDCQDAGFLWNHDASKYTPAADCQFYTFQVKGDI